MDDLSRYQKKEHISIQTRYVSLLLAGSVALVGLVFALGVLMGSRRVTATACPGVDPLAQLDQASEEPSPPKPADDLRFSFHSTLNRPGDMVPTPASLLAQEPATPPGEGVVVPTLGQVSLEQPRHAEPPIPETVRADEPGSYSLQVGSFQDQREASELVHRLSRAGHTAFLVSVNMPSRGGLWYRVRVGPFSSKQTAWRYKKQFEDNERIPAFVVKRRAKASAG